MHKKPGHREGDETGDADEQDKICRHEGYDLSLELKENLPFKALTALDWSSVRFTHKDTFSIK